MKWVKILLKSALTPVTLMVIPHCSSTKTYKLQIPVIAIFLAVIICLTGTIYFYSAAVKTSEYERMKGKLNYYSGQFLELKSTISTLKKAENEFNDLFALKSREAVLEKLDTSDSGSIDLENLKLQIRISMETVGEIKDYLSQQRDIYMSTPSGWPVDGRITSAYGWREHPMTKKRDFHSGMDIAAGPGEPVKATADGIVSFAAWSGGNGKLVVIEHGQGFSTFYGHNKKINVKVGQKVKRGDVISYIGSTGNSTGPHVHYEVWKEGKSVNPYKYLHGRS
ncbi:MAG: M23 family metallopeptidase [Nitrospirota bacterium]|nr:M23 family metallopeptidase [Nitrospirota bacterium]